MFSKIPDIATSIKEFHRHEFLHEVGSTKINDLSISVLASNLEVERDPPIINEIMLT